MEQINHHIKTLLSAHDCVIIPNFGAFIADYSPAVVSDEESTVPGKDILFNRNLTRNDGLLINALIEDQALSYDEAKKAIERYVSTINSVLASGNTHTVEGIGDFSHDEAGFVHFIADASNSCLLDSYGLQAITLEKLTVQKNLDLAVSASDIEQEVIINRRKRLVVRVASVAAVVALLLILASPLTDKPMADYASLGFDDSTQEVLTNTMPVTASGKVSTTTPSEKEAEPLPSHAVEVTSLPLSRTPDKVVKPILDQAQTSFHVIIASLATQQFAKDYVAAFTQTYNFDTVEIMPSSGRYRVSVANFNKKNEALAFIRSLRLLNPKFADAWVLSPQLN